MSGAAARAMVRVVVLLPKLLITNEAALKHDRMIPFHKELFYPYFPLSLLRQALESLQTVSGLQPGTLFSNLFSALFLSVVFVSMETPHPNSNYKTVRCMNNAVIKDHPQLWTVARRVSYQAGSVVAGEATWPPKLDGSLEGFGRAGEANSCPPGEEFPLAGVP